VGYGFISSDHQPLITVFRDLSPTCGQTAAVTGKNMNAAADWSQADDTCLSQYRNLLDIALRSVDIPIISSDSRSLKMLSINLLIDIMMLSPPVYVMHVLKIFSLNVRIYSLMNILYLAGTITLMTNMILLERPF